MALRRAARHALVLAAYAAIALFYLRPIGSCLGTRLLGPGGDSSVFLWNIWHFRHAVTTPGENPFWTDFLYAPSGANLLLHHYSPLLDLFALPLARFGPVLAYNLHMLLSLVLGAYFLYLFARDEGASDGAAFVAGTMLAFSPFVGAIIDSGDGPCYQILWPAVLFVWAFSRVLRLGRLRDALVAALALTAQFTYGYYFFLFCVLLVPVMFVLRERPLSAAVARRPLTGSAGGLARVLDVLCAAAFAAAVASAIGGQTQFHGRGSFRQLAAYVAPYVLFWVLLAARAAVRWTASWRWEPRAWDQEVLLRYAAAPALWAAMNVPVIYGVARMMASDAYATTPASWRGGGNPTDPLSLVVPGAAHPLWGTALSALYRAVRIDAFSEPSLGVVPLAAAVWLWTLRRRGDGPERLWTAAFAFSFVFTLGPWLKVWGVHTYLPLPFYFAHLLPVYNNIQHGMRFIAFAALFLSLVFAFALDRLREEAPARWRRWVVPAAFALLCAEYAPPVRDTVVHQVPPIVARLGERPEGILLTLPLGANFNGSASQGWVGHLALDLSLQAVHRKPLIGGYLGRAPERARRAFESDPFVRGLVDSQDSGTPPRAVTDRGAVGRSLRDWRVRYVLVDSDRITPALAAAVGGWPLRRLDAEGRWALYEPAAR